jgi:hypothetical protein
VAAGCDVRRIDIDDYQDQCIAAFCGADPCTVSTNPQHPVDNLCSNPFMVIGRLLRTPPESNQTGFSGL